MKPNIFCDPYIFACPKQEAGVEAFASFVNNLLEWRKLRSARWAKLYISSTTCEVLADADMYPIWPKVQASLVSFNMKDVQAQDVMEIINTLLSKTPCMEQVCQIQEILLDELKYSPGDHLNKRPQVLIESYKRLLAFICLICDITKFPEASQIIISRSANDSVFVNVMVHGKVADCEMTCSTAKKLPLPMSVSGEFTTCFNDHGLSLSVNPISMWIDSDGEEMQKAALNFYVYQIDSKNTKRMSWSFGRKFFSTAAPLGFLNTEAKVKSLFRSMAETILGTNLQDTHALRENAGPNAPQVLRGLDKACRRDIDKEFHLHYWDTENGPEFASIVHHNDMSIPS
jgi:hypothetical protein